MSSSVVRVITGCVAAAVSMATIGAANPAHAAMLMYEPFDYTGDDLDGKGGSGQLGLSGYWTENTSPDIYTVGDVGPVALSNDDTSLTHPNLSGSYTPIGDRVDAPDTGGGFVERGLAGFTIDLGDDTVHYASALIQGRGVIQFGKSNTVRTIFGVDNSGKFCVGGYGPSTYASTDTYAGGTKIYDADTTYFLVAKIVGNSEPYQTNPEDWYMKIYDPDMTIDLSEPASYDLHYNSTGTGVNMNKIFLGLFDGAQGQIDEIRVGNTWQDVVPIPEPSSVILAALGLFGLLLFAARKRVARL